MKNQLGVLTLDKGEELRREEDLSHQNSGHGVELGPCVTMQYMTIDPAQTYSGLEPRPSSLGDWTEVSQPSNLTFITTPERQIQNM